MELLIFSLNMTGMLVWMFPPIRQFRSRFFIFFLMFAVSDPLGIFCTKVLHISSNYLIYITLTAAALVSLIDLDSLRKYKFLYLFLFLISAGSFVLNPDYILGIIILLLYHLLILIVLFKIFINEFFNNHILNIFLSVLVFYELTAVLKFATLFTGYQNSYLYFGTTTAIQILGGLFFSIIRYDYKRILFQLR